MTNTHKAVSMSTPCVLSTSTEDPVKKKLQVEHAIYLMQTVYVILTETGVEVMLAAFGSDIQATVGSVVSMPLWQLMQLFGPSSKSEALALTAPPFERGQLYVSHPFGTEEDRDELEVRPSFRPDTRLFSSHPHFDKIEGQDRQIALMYEESENAREIARRLGFKNVNPVKAALGRVKRALRYHGQRSIVARQIQHARNLNEDEEEALRRYFDLGPRGQYHSNRMSSLQKAARERGLRKLGVDSTEE